VDAAVGVLREKAVTTTPRGGRSTGEGLIVATSTGPASAIVLEVNSETDFVARNDVFQSFAAAAARTIADNPAVLGTAAGGVRAADMAAVLDLPVPAPAVDACGGAATLKEALANAMYKTGETIVLKRASTLEASEGGRLGVYAHGTDPVHTGLVEALGLGPGRVLGRVGGAVALSAGTADLADKVQCLG
jgi:elongation factor Ts